MVRSVSEVCKFIEDGNRQNKRRKCIIVIAENESNTLVGLDRLKSIMHDCLLICISCLCGSSEDIVYGKDSAV